MTQPLQGNCNLTRTIALTKLLAWLSGSEIGVSSDPDILIAGDLNACELGVMTSVFSLVVQECFLIPVVELRPLHTHYLSFVVYADPATCSYRRRCKMSWPVPSDGPTQM